MFTWDRFENEYMFGMYNRYDKYGKTEIEDFVVKSDPDCNRIELTIANPSPSIMNSLVTMCKSNLPITKNYNFIVDHRNYIKKVIFNNPATIIFWDDGSKTIVKCKKGEKFDKMTGFAMCCCKRFFGDEGSNYQKVFKKWIGEDWEDRK